MKWTSLSTKIIGEVYNEIVGQSCYLCKAQSQTPICEYCGPYIEHNDCYCKGCARPTKRHHILCGECQKHPILFDDCIIPLIYDGLVARLIKDFKFQQQTTYLRILTPYLIQALEKHYRNRPWPQQIIPVPSHPRRIKQRGFCQTILLATNLQKNLSQSIAVNRQGLRKCLDTSPQHRLTKNKREKSQRNAYDIQSHIDATHVALIDDVITTGSTINACVQALKKQGIKRIDVWALARPRSH